MTKTELKPQEVFHFFEEICQIPRPSKKEELIRAYLRKFATERNLTFKEDHIGNILISKPATAGYEDRQTVILQSHIDMVCEKNNDTVHNFDKDPIQTYVDGEWLKAKGTTLGADNGIGVATELAILDAKNIEHGPIECLFTVDEETGLTGAFELQAGFMEGTILLNLDSEDEGELFIGCAGGAGTTATFPLKQEVAPANYTFLKVTVKGLTGGHSGDDINKDRANANKVLNRILMKIAKQSDLKLATIDGGNLHNAIPREAHAIFGIPTTDKAAIETLIPTLEADFRNEYAVTEPNLAVIVETAQATSVMEKESMMRFLHAIYAVHNGVLAMSQDMPGLVETSSNLASIKMKEEGIVVVTSQRSSILSSRKNMSQMIRSAFILGGATVTTGDGYPGWKPNTNSDILKVTVESYIRLFGVEPKVKAIHAGLECGLFLEKYPHLDMVSFGPTLRGVHSPDERMLIPTVEKFWLHLLDVLKHIPQK